jgi:hypothetical protein
MALTDDWDPAELERASRAQQKSSRVIGVPSPEDLAESALMRSGHGNALRNRDLRVLPGGVVVASPRQRPTRNPAPPPRATPAGQPRPAPGGGRSAGDVLRIVASAPAAAGNAVTNAATGGSGDTALGRLIGAGVAGVIVLELGSLFAKKYFTITVGGGTAAVVPAAATAETQPTSGSVPTNPTAPGGLLTSGQLAEILGYNP